MISAHFQSKPFNITVIQVYAPNNNTEEAEAEQFYEDLQDLLELTPKTDVLFIVGLDWMKHKLESRLQGEISITLDMQMTPPLWQKTKN